VDFNRNHFFMFGIIILLLGLQLRMVDSYVLNEKTTKFLAKNVAGKSSTETTLVDMAGPIARKVVRPPEWTGWCLISVGAVLILHSLALKRPG
jgi:hypothetical protein